MFPDLEILIRREPHDRKVVLIFDLTAADPELRLNHRQFSSEPLEQEAAAVVGEHFRELEGLRSQSEDQRLDAELSVEAFGSWLAEKLMPEALRRLLWELVGKATTLLLQSDEPSIPWELVLLRDLETDRPDEKAQFLCEAFALSRWLQRIPPAARALSLRSPSLVELTNRTSEKSRSERAELAQLLAAHGRSLNSIRASKASLVQALESGVFDGVHFCGHGLAGAKSPERARIMLDSGSFFSPYMLSGRARGLGRAQPFVFLNACHTGLASLALTRVSGWSEAFLTAGAGAFLGCFWAVNGNKAREFALTTYCELLGGKPIALAVQLARKELRRQFPGDPTWLAYTLFSNPLAVVPNKELRTHARIPQAPQKTRQPAARRQEVGARASLTSGVQGSPQRTEASGRESLRSPAADGAEVALRKPDVLSDDVHTRSGRADQSAIGVARVARKPGEERLHERDGSVLIYVPGGDFVLGQDGAHAYFGPAHRVQLNPYWISRYPVTNEQYSRFLHSREGVNRPAFWDDPQFNQPKQPVVGISWQEAQAYCDWAGLQLPSEAQWEAAARGPMGRRHPWGDPIPKAQLANFAGREGKTSPVGSYPLGAGPFGTLDQAGNVWEWCLDPWNPAAYSQRARDLVDPIAVGDPSVRAIRGGSWESAARELQCFYRERTAAGIRFRNQGFRCIWKPI